MVLGFFHAFVSDFQVVAMRKPLYSNFTVNGVLIHMEDSEKKAVSRKVADEELDLDPEDFKLFLIEVDPVETKPGHSKSK